MTKISIDLTKQMQAVREKLLRKRLQGSLFSFYRKPATRVLYYKEASLLDVYHCLIDPRVAGRETAQSD